MLEWDYLRVVLAVHRGGSMSAAAEGLGIDRATVLRRLDALEARLKTRLFDRRPDGCVLTAAGRNIIGLVEGVEQAMTALTHRVEGEDRRAEGSVKLAAPEFLLTHVIGPALPSLRAAHPGLALDLRSDYDALDLTRGEADIALRYVRPAHEALVARRVGSLAVALFASRAYLGKRGTPQNGNFAGHDLLMLEGPLGQMPAMGWLLSQMDGANIPMRSNEVGPIVAAVRAGTGIACVPAIAVAGEKDIEPVAPGVVGLCDLFLATHRDLRTRARVRTAYDFITRLLAQRAIELSGGSLSSPTGGAGYFALPEAPSTAGGAPPGKRAKASL